ncbi:hypothetical protein PPS11_35350 [Pseudomonas putida S11]|nr:hypothetical protein PPS11_35350 [Pseudomonas putida S11]
MLSGAAVVGRGVDDPATAVEERLQYNFQLLVLGGTGLHFETAGGTGADHRQRFTGARHLAGQQTRRGSGVQPGAGGQQAQGGTRT